MKLGIFIGRMQPIHIGHQKIIEKSLEENNLTFIVLGSSNTLDSNNIFTDKQRIKFLKLFLHKKTRNKILFLKDTQSDKQWVENLNTLINKTGEQYLEATLKRLVGGKNINLSPEDLELQKQSFSNHTEQITFYGGDLKKDYAIKIIKQFEDSLDYKKIVYTEVDRNNVTVNYNNNKITFSSTIVREELQNKNYSLLQKILHPKVLKEIKNITLD